MTSLQIISAKETIKKYLDETVGCKEVSRLIVKEIYEELQRDALSEALAEAQKGDINGSANDDYQEKE